MFSQDTMIGECHIDFEKLLSNIVSFSAKKEEQMIDNAMDSMLKKENSSQLSRRSTLKKKDQKEVRCLQEFVQRRDFTDLKLWHSGRLIGTISGNLKFINLPFL